MKVKVQINRQVECGFTVRYVLGDASIYTFWKRSEQQWMVWLEGVETPSEARSLTALGKWSIVRSHLSVNNPLHYIGLGLPEGAQAADFEGDLLDLSLDCQHFPEAVAALFVDLIVTFSDVSELVHGMIKDELHKCEARRDALSHYLADLMVKEDE